MIVVHMPGGVVHFVKRSLSGTLPSGKSVLVVSGEHGFSVVNPGEAGLQTGRFDDGDALQLADGVMLTAEKS